MDAWYPTFKKFKSVDEFAPVSNLSWKRLSRLANHKDWLTIFVGIIALCMVVQLFANVALISATITLKNQVAIRAKK